MAIRALEQKGILDSREVGLTLLLQVTRILQRECDTLSHHYKHGTDQMPNVSLPADDLAGFPERTLVLNSWLIISLCLKYIMGCQAGTQQAPLKLDLDSSLESFVPADVLSNTAAAGAAVDELSLEDFLDQRASIIEPFSEACAGGNTAIAHSLLLEVNPPLSLTPFEFYFFLSSSLPLFLSSSLPLFLCLSPFLTTQ